jgi:Ca2+-binding EF-hand superfamily protein
MSSISSVGSSTAAQYASASSRVGHDRRPDPSKMAENLFSQLDTKGQGYLEKSDLASALGAVDSGTSSGSSASVDDVFAALDGDGDGKVTQSELSTSLQKLADELDSQFDQSRMAGAMPPPPPGGGRGPGQSEEDEGLSKDQLSAIADSTDDSQLSELMSNLAANFDSADANGDGKVTRDEAMAYQESSQTQGGSAAAGGPGGMPPPPGGGDDQGMTLDQMKSVASSTTDSKLSDLLNTISSNFDAADANGDGKVTQQEAMAYQQSQQSDSATAGSSNSSGSSADSNSSSSEAAVMKRIMDLVHAYGTSGSGNSDTGFSQLLSAISTSA